MNIYVHAGNNRTIRTRDIIGIFDMDTATMAPATREYLRAAERDGRMINISEDLPKSIIIAKSGRGKEEFVYISQISTSALIGRTKTKSSSADC
jgi:hypothetical protein